MDFSIDETMQAYLDDAEAIAKQLHEGYQQREDDGVIPLAIRTQMGAAGLIAPEMPAAYGGRDERALTSGMIIERLSRADINVTYVQVVASLVSQILLGNASEELKTTWIPKITSGQDIVAIGLSEPGAGSDAGNPGLTAKRQDGGWVLHGTKSMSFAIHAGAALVFARTSEGRRGRGITAFLVELDRENLTRQRANDMGTRAVGRGFVTFEGTWIPDTNMLGQEGAAFTQVMQGFDFSRALIGLQVIGAARQTLEETWQHVRERHAFDQNIGKFQGVSFPLAEADTYLTGLEVLCQKTLWLKDEGLSHSKEAAMCKWWAPKTAYEVINQCLLSHGQFGYLKDLPIEQRMRDVLGLQIGDGTAQIMKLIIARHNLGREFAP